MTKKFYLFRRDKKLCGVCGDQYPTSTQERIAAFFPPGVKLSGGRLRLKGVMLHLEKVNKTYHGAVPLYVLKDVSLDVARVELVSIMGASGSEKSTLLNILGILDSYDYGLYSLDGMPPDMIIGFRTLNP